jgi:hypothetical protein
MSTLWAICVLTSVSTSSGTELKPSGPIPPAPQTHSKSPHCYLVPPKIPNLNHILPATQGSHPNRIVLFSWPKAPGKQRHFPWAEYPKSCAGPNHKHEASLELSGDTMKSQQHSWMALST